jgi:oxaloacetate decarboxylase (Na+ extruding) subunit alpha
MGTATYVEGVRAGAGAIDCAISVMSSRSSQPPVETMLAIFNETSYQAHLDLDCLRKICQYFEELAPKRESKNMPINPIDPDILVHHIPGGMISNLRSQLAQQDALHRLPEVLEELPRTRADMGYPPLVTPTSQIVGIQSVLNVLAGERYAMIPEETRNYVKGQYGNPPAPIDKKLAEKILGKTKPITCRPADMLEPMLPNATDGVPAGLIQSEEDVISYCIFPEVALEYFKWRALPTEERPDPPVVLERQQEEDAVNKAPAKATPEVQRLLSDADYRELNDLASRIAALQLNEFTIRRNDFTLSLRGNGVQLGSDAVPQQATAAKPADVAPKPAAAPTVEGKPVPAPLNGTFYLSPGPGKPQFVKEGDSVKAGDTLCIVEAMKLFNQIKSPVSGTVAKILIKHGEAVQKGQPMILIA